MKCVKDSTFTYTEQSLDSYVRKTKGKGGSASLSQFIEEYFEHVMQKFSSEDVWSNNTYLNLPDGTIIQKKHRVPTGSTLILLVNILANMAVQWTLLRYLAMDFTHAKALGDDFSFYMECR